MSLLVAVPCGIAAAVAYGASTAVEHSAVNTGDGDADARGLIGQLRNPRWLLGMAGDVLGLVLQIAALATGPVVLVQPLLVLALPISLPISRALGGPRPTRADFVSCGLIVLALGAFFVILRNPGDASILTVQPAVITIGVTLAGVAIAVAAVHGRPPAVRAVTYGVAAGVSSGVVGVLLDAAAASWSAHGIRAVLHADGYVPVAGLIAIGTVSVVLTQVALQIGDLGASFPASLSADPVIAVVLGAALLGETVPTAPLQVLAYVLCFAAIVAGAVRLARAADH
jgi:hypothetical protein